MAQFFKLYVLAIVTFGVLDAIWLGVVMKNFYRTQLWPIARTAGDALAPIWPAALLVYLLLAFGVVAFVQPRASGTAVIPWGAAFGAVVYGVYDLTNYATLRSYSASLTVVDIAWGACATAAVAWVVATADRLMQ